MLTGIQLIDRNDELCILYEKANIQEQILRNGQLQLNTRHQELRVLELELGKYEWLYGVTTKLLPVLPKYKKEIDELRSALEEEKKRSDVLSDELESPSNESRYRLLKGKDLTPVCPYTYARARAWCVCVCVHPCVCVCVCAQLEDEQSEMHTTVTLLQKQYGQVCTSRCTRR